MGDNQDGGAHVVDLFQQRHDLQRPGRVQVARRLVGDDDAGVVGQGAGDGHPLLRRSVGVIFQDFRLIEKKTVYENLGFAMRAVGSSPREIKKRIPYVLELVGLEEKTDRYPNELSGGEQQRVAIARALINNPSTIIADEPTGNLDPARSLEIMRLLERINQLGTTMVVVTHEKDLVNQFKKRVVTLEQGVITSDGDGVGYNAR